MELDPKLYLILTNLDIKHTILNHKVITTMAQGAEIMTQLEGSVPVNLLLKDKQGQHYLMIKNMENKSKLKSLNIKGLQMESRSALPDLLKVPEGCATVFALLNDPKHEIIVLIDKTIPENDKVNFHPLRNNATMTIEYNDMIRFVEHLGNEIMYF